VPDLAFDEFLFALLNFKTVNFELNGEQSCIFVVSLNKTLVGGETYEKAPELNIS